LHHGHKPSGLTLEQASHTTLRTDSGNLTYIRTTRRITSGDELKHLKWLGGLALDLRGIRVL